MNNQTILTILPLVATLAVTLAIAPAPARAQKGTANYHLVESLRERTTNKVFRATVRPNWIGKTDRFWYRNDLANGKREFVLVDPEAPRKGPAFDHARMATALTKALGKPVAGDELPLDALEFDPQKPIVKLRAGGKSFVCDLGTYELQPTTEAFGAATARPPGAVRSSRRTGDETTLTINNKTAGEIELFWLDTEGGRRSYGTLKPGESRPMHTFAGHAWLAVAKADNTPLAAFVAEELPTLFVVEGPVRAEARTPPPGPPRRQGTSPDGKWRVAVREHNVWLIEVATNTETRLTTDGSASDTYDGQVYWSPDSTRLVMIKTEPEQEHTVTLVESSPKDQEQPKYHSHQYLKPGDRISHPRPHLFDIVGKRDIPVPDALFPNPWYIDELQWEPDNSAFTFLYNQRGHQVMRLVSVDAHTGQSRAAIEETQKTFIDWTNKVYFHRVPGTGEALWMSERDGWNHLYLYDTKTGTVKNPITKGDWTIRGIDKVDDTKRQIWFRAGGIIPGQDPYQVHYCRVNYDGTGLTLLTDGDGTHVLTYSPDNRYAVDTYSRPDLAPVTELRRMDTGKKVLDLEKGDASALLTTGWRYPERFVAKGRDDKTDIYGLIYRPTNFDPKRKYPVIEDIYAGPQSAFVQKAFAAAPGNQSMAELGFIVVQIDGMGTNWRSKAFHDVCFKNLVDGGFPDRVKWIKAAAAKRPEMDLTRGVGIYGTSAGGQNALAGLLTHPDFYTVGVADCGCHDNRMDKIWWNEQWMGWPVGPEYAANSNVTLAAKLQGKLLLMVGEMDTNVDPASTMQVANALIGANKDFDLLVAPGVGHGVAGTPYGRRRLQDFFVRNLLQVAPPERNAMR